MSARSYAYRDDVSVYDALAHVQYEWEFKQRLYVAEYDFTSFFDNISHEHLWRTMEAYRFRITPKERQIVEAFLNSAVDADEYAEPVLYGEAGAGIPQGTSISLFLANLAVVELDRKLEQLGIGFARYADDTLVWSNSYDKVAKAAEAIYDVSTRLGSPINQSKSAGIRLLIPRGTIAAEMSATHEVDYLSHSLRLGSTALKKSVVQKILTDVNGMIYDHLLREPIAARQEVDRLTRLDRDYVAYIWQLRRYLYGHMSESDVRRGLGDATRVKRLTGIVARYPYANDRIQLNEIDTQIRTRTWLALQKRKRLLFGSSALTTVPVTWSLDQRSLYNYQGFSGRTGQDVDVRLPSIYRMSRLVSTAISYQGNAILGSGQNLYTEHE